MEGWRLSFINSLWQRLLCDGTGETYLWRKNAEFIIRKPYFSSWLCSLFSTAESGGGVMISWVLSALSRSYSYPEVLGRCAAFPPFVFLWNVDMHLWPLLIQVKVLWSYDVLWLHPQDGSSVLTGDEPYILKSCFALRFWVCDRSLFSGNPSVSVYVYNYHMLLNLRQNCELGPHPISQVLLRKKGSTWVQNPGVNYEA